MDCVEGSAATAVLHCGSIRINQSMVALSQTAHVAGTGRLTDAGETLQMPVTPLPQ
jgi:hypothetical protein